MGPPRGRPALLSGRRDYETEGARRQGLLFLGTLLPSSVSSPLPCLVPPPMGSQWAAGQSDLLAESLGASAASGSLSHMAFSPTTEPKFRSFLCQGAAPTAHYLPTLHVDRNVSTSRLDSLGQVPRTRSTRPTPVFASDRRHYRVQRAKNSSRSRRGRRKTAY